MSQRTRASGGIGRRTTLKMWREIVRVRVSLRPLRLIRSKGFTTLTSGIFLEFTGLLNQIRNQKETKSSVYRLL